MATFFDLLAREIARQVAERYKNCREDIKISADTPYTHPPVLHFSTNFSILPGSVESVKIDGLKTRKHRVSSIDAIGRELLAQCTGLRELSLVYVQLQSFTGIPRLPLLKSLQMQGNQIDSFKGLLHQPSLVELNLWGNLIKGFKCFPFLPQLRDLNVSYNQITGQLARLVARAPKLQILKLALNPLADESELFPLEQLPELRHLELYGCPVAKKLQQTDSVFMRSMRARGVRVVLRESRMPPEVLLQLKQMQQEQQEKQKMALNNGGLPTITFTTARH